MVKPRLRKRLGDLLVEEGVISNDQLMAALKNQKGKGIKLGASLIDLGYINEEQLLKFLAKQLNIPFYDLSKVKIDQAAVQLIPEVQARRLRVLCIHAEPDRATVVMSDPADLNAMDSVAALLMPREIEFAVARESQLLTSFGQLYRKTKEIESFASQLQEEYKASDFDMKLLRMIFEDAVQVHASDIHIEPDEKVLRIRQRIDGVLHETDLNEVGIAPALVLRLKLMSGLNISEKRLPQDGRFKIRARGHDVDVRISTLPIQNGESVVMRLLDQTSGLLNLNDVGMPPQILEKFRRELHRPHGLILVTGPTGSGKTTTLYGALSELNEPGTKIITAEDPVEFRLPRVSQVQINSAIGLDFSRVLRACLRQDPDIILVGEMRDKETCEIGLRGAITGHLVLTTLHTNDAVSSALRLMDMGAPGYLVAAALRVVIAQRLVRRICPDCKEEYIPDESDRRFIDDVIGPGASQHVFYHGRGCQTCNYTGYKGRIGVFEILDLKGEMMDALRAEDTERFSRAANADPDYVPLSHMAYDYALQGITSLDEVLRLAEIAK